MNRYSIPCLPEDSGRFLSLLKKYPKYSHAFYTQVNDKYGSVIVTTQGIEWELLTWLVTQAVNNEGA
jgi:hypothetical protein